jgi:O-antigen/teichoic acid export membrane protein
MLKTKLFKDLFGVATLQILQILLSASIGFILLRLLSKPEYAIFNLFTNSSATFLGIASMSTTVLFIPFANKFGIAKANLIKSTVIYKVLNKPMIYIGFFIGAVLCFSSAIKNNWLDWKFTLACLFILFAFYNQYLVRFYESFFKLNSDPLKPFMANFFGETFRLGMILMLFFFFKDKFSGKLVPILFLFLFFSTVLSRKILEYKAGFKLNIPVEIDAEHKKTFWDNFRPLLFPSFFFQVTQLFRNSLIYFVTGTNVIAEAAALGRLMMLFSAMDKVVEMVIIPRLGKQKDNRIFLKNLAISIGFICIVGAGLLTSAFFYPKLWLWLLGEKYANIEIALLWAIVTTIVERISGLIMFAQLSKGKTKGQWWVPILATLSYYLFFYFNGIHSAEDATKGLLVSALVNLSSQLLIFIYLIRKTEI